MRAVAGIPAVPSNPFLFEKIKDRMEAAGRPVEATRVFHRPAWRIAAVCLLLAVNAWFIGSYGFASTDANGVTEANVEYTIDSYRMVESNYSIYN